MLHHRNCFACFGYSVRLLHPEKNLCSFRVRATSPNNPYWIVCLAFSIMCLFVCLFDKCLYYACYRCITFSTVCTRYNALYRSEISACYGRVSHVAMCGYCKSKGICQVYKQNTLRYAQTFSRKFSTKSP